MYVRMLVCALSELLSAPVDTAPREQDSSENSIQLVL